MFFHILSKFVTAILLIIFRGFLIFYQILLLPQVKRVVIISGKNGI